MKVLLDDVSFWFHDLCSCLQDCFGSLLLRHGQDPVTVLGAAWEFFHTQEQVRGEEFYYPARRPTLGENLVPFHPIRAEWREPVDAATGWEQIRASVADGRPAIAAVDNFHMPIRPAYGDVHAAHLMVVWGFNDETEEVYVCESTPPVYSGPVELATFLRARDSVNEARLGTRDYFFAGSGIRNRWIDVSVTGQFPELTREWVAEVVETNVRGFLAPDLTVGSAGLAGLSGWLERIEERVATDDASLALGELYTVGWAAQSATALHADFLRQMGNRFGCDEIVEAGRLVDRLANCWTPLRILGAHGSTSGERFDDQLRMRSKRFTAEHEETLSRLADALPALLS